MVDNAAGQLGRHGDSACLSHPLSGQARRQVYWWHQPRGKGCHGLWLLLFFFLFLVLLLGLLVPLLGFARVLF